MKKEVNAGEIPCPHCKYLHEYFEYLDHEGDFGNFEMICERCEKEFNVEFRTVFHFTTTAH